MKKFKFKKRGNKIIKIIVLIFIIYIIFGININIKLFSSNEEFINNMLKDSNYYIKYEENNNIVSNLVKMMFTYKSNVNSNVVTPVYKEESVFEPVIYIYNSHQLENYNKENYEAYNITPNVMMASYIFKEMLEKEGIPTLVESSNIVEYMNLNNYSFGYSYKASRFFLENRIKEYPSLNFFIDLHRDSVTKKYSTAIINNKEYAKILFVVGLEHNNYKENLDTATKINNIVKSNYPTLTRGVLTKQGAGVNGIYNQDIGKNAILIEVGAYQNNIDEVYNTLEILAPIIKEYLYGK